MRKTETINSKPEFQFKPFYDSSTQPQWGQLFRLGGDRVAVLFKELRQSLGRIEGLTERLHFSSIEDGWGVQYRAGNTELFTARISPGILEVKIPSDSAAGGGSSQMPALSAILKREVQGSENASFIRLCLRNRALVRSFSRFVVARSRLTS